MLSVLRYSARNLSRTLSSEADDLRVSLAAEEAASNAGGGHLQRASVGLIDYGRIIEHKYNPPEPDEESVGAASSRSLRGRPRDGDEVNPLPRRIPRPRRAVVRGALIPCLLLLRKFFTETLRHSPTTVGDVGANTVTSTARCRGAETRRTQPRPPPRQSARAASTALRRGALGSSRDRLLRGFDRRNG